ncbi:Ig-like domain-containing protein [Pelodictyon luteolum]|uniref:SbsA Ig-like domain-containing protein n=1 Tax=Chlorobium luteolum (strain DSM 273 / BCRC 81028 / 2530) TaxID=319225 RepID=Q3B6C4_CHLL3|nr:Ig-like domain-containing protein [Pelodictyon luteolum]ABB23107.1 conserved hypothetical protein [Pelodictyon luteolum DSM 273]
MKGTTHILKALLILLAVGTAGCASDKPPTGGLPDPTPRQVFFSDPDSGAVNISPRKIRFLFSHLTTARELLYSLHFSPQVDNYHVTVNGMEGEIDIFSPLRPNQTYIVTLNKRLFESYTLPFSTGPQIDTSLVRGRVFNEDMTPSASAFVLAYRLRDGEKRAPDMRQAKPDYLAQTDGSGNFSFRHLKKGAYSLLAVNDSNGDMRWDRHREAIGITTAAVVHPDTTRHIIRMGGIDSETSGMSACRPLERNRLELTFTSPVDVATFNPGAVTINNPRTGKSVPVLDWFSSTGSSVSRRITILTGRLDTGGPSLISIHGREGQAISFWPTRHTVEKLPIRVTFSPADKSRPGYQGADIPCSPEAVVLRFSEPVPETIVGSAASLSIEGDDSPVTLDCLLKKIDAKTFTLRPREGFRPGATYRASVDSALVNGIEVRPGAKRTTFSRFTAASPDDMGSITGSCRASGGPVIVEARGTATWRTEATRDATGRYVYAFPGLPPGSYALSAFIPSMAKKGGACMQQPYPGTLFPFTPADPSAVHEGSVRVRAQWTAENIDITFTNEKTDRNPTP